MKKIILASESPRRKEILKKAGLKFKIVKSNFEEYVNSDLKPANLVKKLSLEKATAVYENHEDSIIIAADTVVVCRGKILGKPKNNQDAKDMLEFLSNKSHLIITGFAIISSDLKKPITKSEQTKVYMRKITKKEIESYVKTGEPKDKAGAYAIQGIAKKFIKIVEGDFSNAVGLPIQSVLKELKKMGIKMI
ncbi:MAG: septum formation inhibitor Maf [Candidatus Levybacteria bacterium]|nr:septum formation inhibitor Maf [Candidatus Levybacteria bacterium]